MTESDAAAERLLPLIPRGRENAFGFFNPYEPQKPWDRVDRRLPVGDSGQSFVFRASVVDPRAWAALIAIRHDDVRMITIETLDPTSLGSLPEPQLRRAGEADDAALLTDDWRNVSRVLEQTTGSSLYPVDLARRIDELDDIIDRDLIISLFGVIASSNSEDVDHMGHLHGAQTHAVLLRILYARLGWFDHILASSAYVLGDAFTDADANLFGVLLTFDIGYRPAFPTPDALISDYPHLWEYAKRIYRQSKLVTEEDKIALGLIPDAQARYRSLWKLPVEGEFFDRLRRAWNN